MGRITWALVVLATWFGSEGLTFFAFGWPVDWRELPTVAAILVIAVTTFPKPTH